MNHTPAPWTISDEIDPLIYSNATGAYVAQVFAYDGRNNSRNAAVDADARLIAAAPDLLAALIEAVEIIESTGLDASPARAAIAAAKGQA